MATVKFRKKKHLGSGNFEYTYFCKCGSGEEKKDVKVVSGNDNEAKSLALVECETVCGEVPLKQ